MQPISNGERKVNARRAYDDADMDNVVKTALSDSNHGQPTRICAAEAWGHDDVSCASNEPSAKETILISGQRPRTRGRALKPRGLSELN